MSQVRLLGALSAREGEVQPSVPMKKPVKKNPPASLPAELRPFLFKKGDAGDMSDAPAPAALPPSGSFSRTASAQESDQGNPPRQDPCLATQQSQSRHQYSMPNMTGRPGYRTMEMNGGRSAPYLARTPCVPLFCTLFNRGGNRRAFRLPGAGGDHFH